MFESVKVCVVFAMSVTLLEKSETVEDCHLIILPTFPPNIKEIEFVPEQTLELPETVPPTDAGATIIPETELKAVVHDAFETTAL